MPISFCQYPSLAWSKKVNGAAAGEVTQCLEEGQIATIRFLMSLPYRQIS
jgi:hypothetical protein